MAEAPEHGLYDPGSISLLLDASGGVRLEGVAFGPAGAITVETADGSAWAVDHADPDQLVTYEPAAPTIGGDALSRDEHVVAFVGGDDAMAFGDELDRRREELEAEGVAVADPDDFELVGGPAGVGSRRTARRSNRPGGRPRRGAMRVRLPPRRRVLPTAMADLMVLVDLSDDPDLPPLARVAAGVDLLRRTDVTPGGDLLRQRHEQVVGALLAAAGDVDRDEVASLDPRLIAGLVRLLVGAEKLHPDLDRGLAELRRWCEDLDVSGRVAELPRARSMEDAAAGSSSEPPVLADAELDVSFVSAFPAGGPGEPSDPDLRRTTGKLVVDVTVERRSPVLIDVWTDDPRAVGRWFVIRRTEGQVHIGHAPVEEREPGIYGSVVAVPPDLSDEDCTVLLVDQSELETDGGSPLRLIREAIRAGRDACRAERLDRWSEARSAWNRCAELWTVAGDEQRAALAAEHAEYGSPAGLQVGSIADAIAMEGAQG